MPTISNLGQQLVEEAFDSQGLNFRVDQEPGGKKYKKLEIIIETIKTIGQIIFFIIHLL